MVAAMLLLAAFQSSALAQGTYDPKYACEPKSWDELRFGSSLNFIVAVWYCDLSGKIEKEFYCGNPANAVGQFIKASFTDVKSAAKRKLSRACTKEEIALADETTRKKGPLFRVAKNGAATDRPGYDANMKVIGRVSILQSDGITPTWCEWKRLVDQYGKNTNYFEIQGRPGVYAICTFDGPLSKP